MFSIRSESDVGVGEFLDLKLLVDWAVASGFHLVQLLPINDTSVHRMWWDSYPYRYSPWNFCWKNWFHQWFHLVKLYRAFVWIRYKQHGAYQTISDINVIKLLLEKMVRMVNCCFNQFTYWLLIKKKIHILIVRDLKLWSDLTYTYLSVHSRYLHCIRCIWEYRHFLITYQRRSRLCLGIFTFSWIEFIILECWYLKYLHLL